MRALYRCDITPGRSHSHLVGLTEYIRAQYGNQNNSLFAVIPKLEQGHLFDRLYAQKPDKKLKFAIEKCSKR